MKKQFEAIDALQFHPTFDTACLTLRKMLHTIRFGEGDIKDSHGRDADDMPA
ncbi:hypothetical protein RBA41_01695 [Massilia sp. CCM 9210]|uniref:hypothetical protein n=1 Tax=Massilia scottii TaxID=3057166 RepID=UPI002796475F|nr:hypothetical protein [Massilia sp. CCM 9210]MDQ1812008.1 hypothetical protein [Massilia sp. CCM 9210]